LRTNLNSIEASQQQVEDDQVRVLLHCQSQASLSVDSNQDSKSLSSQHTLELFEGFGVLIHQQNAF